MARGRKAANAATMLTAEDRLRAALVPEEEWPYPVPENWCWVRLTSGFAECLDRFRQPVNANERSSRQGEIPYYGATGQVGWIDNFLTDEQLVLVGEDGAPFLDLLKNKAYLIEGKAWVNNHAHILRSFYGEIGNQFLMHYLNIFDFSNYVNGTTRLKLTQASLNLIPVPLPPLPEQQRIVDRIESLFAKLDEAKEKAQAALDSFETRRAAILHKAFTGELTAKWREENGVSFESWGEKSLIELCEKITDGTHNSPINTSSGDYMYVTAKNIKENGIDLSDVTYINCNEHNEIYKRCNVEKGDVLYIKDGATTGIATVNTIDVQFSLLSSVALLKPKKLQLNAKFLAYSLNSPHIKSKMLNNMSGNAITRLTISKIKQATITTCSLVEQNEIVNILDSVFANEHNAIQTAQTSLDHIDLIKKSILARAFCGELGTNNFKEKQICISK